MDIHWYESLSSTNDEAKRLAKEGAAHGSIVGADFQKSGRGRTGKSWVCEKGEGLMCSIILRPKWDKKYWGWIALTAGLALSELLQRDCLRSVIKWPNDILVNGKKIAGILTEADEEAVIVGIGMNLNMQTLPEVESKIKPTSFFIETGCTLDSRSYARSLQQQLVQLLSADSPLLIRSTIFHKLAWNDTIISLTTKADTYTGKITGLGDFGQLLLETESGEQEIYDAYNIRPIT